LVPEPSDGVILVHEDNFEPDRQPFLAQVTKNNPLPLSNIERFLLPAVNSKPK